MFSFPLDLREWYKWEPYKAGIRDNCDTCPFLLEDVISKAEQKGFRKQKNQQLRLSCDNRIEITLSQFYTEEHRCRVKNHEKNVKKKKGYASVYVVTWIQ